jgi:outer membrane protein TolC
MSRSLVIPPAISSPPLLSFILLPSTLNDAMTLGDGENPVVLAAVYSEEASLYAVQQIMGELLPVGTLRRSTTSTSMRARTIRTIETTTVTGRVNVPFYQGGSVSARVRQAKETNNQLKKEVEDARLRVHADVIANWGIFAVLRPRHRFGLRPAVDAQQNRPDWRARGGESRPSHYARRPRRPAGAPEFADRPSSRRSATAWWPNIRCTSP